MSRLEFALALVGCAVAAATLTATVVAIWRTYREDHPA